MRAQADREAGARAARSARLVMVAGAVASLVAVAVAILAAPAAPGARTPRPVTVRDPLDARFGGPDLVMVRLGPIPGGQLRAVLALSRPWLPKDLLAGHGPPGSLCLRLWTRTRAGAAPPDYLVCVTARADGETTRGSILRVRDGRPLQRVRGALVGRTSQSDATLRFSASAIGSPRTIRFAGEATKAGCGGVGCVDTAPAAPATATLRLRASA